MKQAYMLLSMVLVVACGPARDVVTDESFAARKADDMAKAMESTPDAIEKVQAALTCENWYFDVSIPGWRCGLWCPDVNSGFYSCSNDQNTYAGETNYWFQNSYGGTCCQGHGDISIALLNSETNDKFKSAKCRRSGGTRIYQESGFWGSTTLLLNGGDYATIPVVNGISSISTP